MESNLLWSFGSRVAYLTSSRAKDLTTENELPIQQKWSSVSIGEKCHLHLGEIQPTDGSWPEDKEIEYLLIQEATGQCYDLNDLTLSNLKKPVSNSKLN